jgi:type IV pilus assembly protein PilC
MATSDVMLHYWYAWLAGLFAVSVVLVLFLRTPRGRRTADFLKLRTPILRNMYLKLYITRACRTMGTMVSAGIAMLDMIAIVKQVTNNVYFEELWDEVDGRLRKGAQLSDPLFDSILVPRAVAQMIYSGEKSGRLGAVMGRIAAYTEDEFDDAVKTSTQFIEPLMVAFMGVLIGFIAIALLLPIFNIGRVMAGN